MKRQSLFWLLLCAALLLGTVCHAMALDISTVARETGTYADGNVSAETLSYRLYVPEDYDASKEYSLLVYFHDEAGAGKDNLAPISDPEKTAIIESVVTTSTYAKNVFVLIPQCPEGKTFVEGEVQNGTYAFSEEEGEISKLFMGLLEKKILADYSINKNAVCLTGISSGATMVYDLVARYPGKFMSALAISGAVDPLKLEQYEQTNLEAFGAKDDTELSYAGLDVLKTSAKTDSKLIVRLTETGGHTLYKEVYSDPENLKWLIGFSPVSNEADNTPDVDDAEVTDAPEQREEVTDAEKAEEDNEGDEKKQNEKSFFERNNISQRMVAAVILAIAILVGTILLIIANKTAKERNE